MFIYLNGEMVPEEKATISLFDHGYLYGLGLFETFRTYEGVPFLLADHLDRLEMSCQEIGFVWNRDDSKIKEQIQKLLEANQLEDGYFRLILSAGPHGIGLRNEPYRQITESLLIKELPPQTKAKKLITVQTRRNSPEGRTRLKSHHYLNNILAKRETPPDAEGVFLTEQNKIAEGVVSNVFFVKKGVLYTPSLATGILNGITRQWVLHVAKALGVQVNEGEYELPYAMGSDEVFVTNSIQEIVPVHEWDGKIFDRIGKEQASVVGRLKEAYKKCKGSELTIKSIRV